MKAGRMELIVREAIETERRTDNMYGKEVFSPSKSWKPLANPETKTRKVPFSKEK
jgi:hypothetical protein